MTIEPELVERMAEIIRDMAALSRNKHIISYEGTDLAAASARIARELPDRDLAVAEKLVRDAFAGTLRDVVVDTGKIESLAIQAVLVAIKHGRSEQQGRG